MKKSITTQLWLGAFIFFLFLSFGNTLFAQGVKLNKSDHPFLYLSTAYVNSYSISQGTIDPYYSGSNNSFSDKTVRADLGLQLNRNISFEVGYIRTPLWLTKKLAINGQTISGGGGASYTRISFYSFKLKHAIPISTNKFLLKTGLGYALGSSQIDIGTLGPSEPKTFTSFGNTITTSSTITDLYKGSTHFLTFDLGLELAFHKKFSVFSNATLYRGFKDIQQQEIEYNINGEEGSFTTTTDGSFFGFEAGLKYNFR